LETRSTWPRAWSPPEDVSNTSTGRRDSICRESKLLSKWCYWGRGFSLDFCLSMCCIESIVSSRVSRFTRTFPAPFSNGGYIPWYIIYKSGCYLKEKHGDIFHSLFLPSHLVFFGWGRVSVGKAFTPTNMIFPGTSPTRTFSPFLSSPTI